MGGKSVTDSKLRNSVVMLFTPSGNCTGILLDEKTVITAAHCLLNEDGEKELNVSVGYFGQSSLPSSLQDAKEVLSYKMEAGKDVGLVFLTDKFSRDENDSLPILSLPEISDEDEFCLVGTGQNNSMSLQILCDFHFIAQTKEGTVHIYNQIGSLAGGDHGDSGGPVFRKNAHGILELVGILSGGTIYKENNVETRINVFTKISNPSALNWINKNISNHVQNLF